MERNLSRGVYWLVQLPPQQWYRLGNVVTSDVFGPLHQHPPEWYPRHGFGYLLLNYNEYGGYLDDPAGFPREAAWYTEALARFPTVRVFGGAGPRVTLLSTGLDGGAMQHDSAARFGAGDGGDGELALLGYNLGPTDQERGPYFPGDSGDAGVAPGPFRAGGKIGLTLLWQALRAPGGDYQVFVHLRDEGGRTVAQRDTRPQNDRHPTTAWRAGDLVLDDASLPLPATLPPGRYTIVLGLYPPGRPRLPVRPQPDLAPAPNDELPLATIEVVR